MALWSRMAPGRHTSKGSGHLSWKFQHCPFSASTFVPGGPPSYPTTPSPCTTLCHHRVPGEGPEGQRWGKHPIPRDQGLEEAAAQVRGRRGSGPLGGRGPLCTDVSSLRAKREGKFPWAICTLEQSKN